MAKGSLNLTKVTTSTQNADLREALLLAFEEKIERKRLTSSDLSLSSTGSPNPSLLSTPSITARFSIPTASSTPSSRISLPITDPFSPISLPQAERTPQRMQITASSAENDSIYLCSEESLRTLFSFSCNTLSTSCCYRGKPLDCESLVFNRQSHVVSVTISCVSGDSFKWLSSPIMGGSPPKYDVNLSLEKAWLLDSREEGLQWVDVGCSRTRFHVAEAAHDFVLQLKTWILSKGVLNSFDSWHGAKSVTKAMKKVALRPQRDEGSKWFFELSDKGKSCQVPCGVTVQAE
nr:uncharacterized protein LOC131774109 [Pocillopora verrucosa]